MCEANCRCMGQHLTIEAREIVTTREALSTALRDAVSYMDYDLYKALDDPEDDEDVMTFDEVLNRFVKNLEAK